MIATEKQDEIAKGNMALAILENIYDLNVSKFTAAEITQAINCLFAVRNALRLREGEGVKT